MQHGVLTEYVETGFYQLKQGAGLPEGLLTDFAAVVRQLGDEGMLELAEPLGIKERIEASLAQAPDPRSLPVESWQQAVDTWESISDVLPVIVKLLRACERAEALERKGALEVNFVLVRGLAVIAYAPFAPGGGELLNELAAILGGEAAEPAALLDRYIRAVMEKDNDTLADIDRLILENPLWRQWWERLLAAGKSFPFAPKVIGISPPLTDGLKQVIVNMMMEVLNAHHSRDN